MDEEEDKSTGSTGFIIACAAIVIPLLYVLSIGPVAMVCEKTNIPHEIEQGFELFYAPLIWLHDHTFLQDPLKEYVMWWMGI